MRSQAAGLEWQVHHHGWSCLLGQVGHVLSGHLLSYAPYCPSGNYQIHKQATARIPLVGERHYHRGQVQGELVHGLPTQKAWGAWSPRHGQIRHDHEASLTLASMEGLQQNLGGL